MRTLPLNENVTVVLNAFGDGTARVGPNGHGVTWFPRVASVRVNSGTNPANQAACEIFAGNAATADNFIDATETGSTGDSTDSFGDGMEIRLGSYVWAVWHNGDPGSQATLTVTGSQETG